MSKVSHFITFSDKLWTAVKWLSRENLLSGKRLPPQIQGWSARKKSQTNILAFIWFGLALLTPNWEPDLQRLSIFELGFNWSRFVSVSHEEISWVFPSVRPFGWPTWLCQGVHQLMPYVLICLTMPQNGLICHNRDISGVRVQCVSWVCPRVYPRCIHWCS